MRIATLRGIYVRSLFLVTWFVLIAAAAVAIVGHGQSAYPLSSHAVAR